MRFVNFPSDLPNLKPTALPPQSNHTNNMKTKILTMIAALTGRLRRQFKIKV